MEEIKSDGPSAAYGTDCSNTVWTARPLLRSTGRRRLSNWAVKCEVCGMAQPLDRIDLELMTAAEESLPCVDRLRRQFRVRMLSVVRPGAYTS